MIAQRIEKAPVADCIEVAKTPGKLGCCANESLLLGLRRSGLSLWCGCHRGQRLSRFLVWLSRLPQNSLNCLHTHRPGVFARNCTNTRSILFIASLLSRAIQRLRELPCTSYYPYIRKALTLRHSSRDDCFACRKILIQFQRRRRFRNVVY